MNSKDTHFKRRKPVYKRFELNLDSTPQSIYSNAKRNNSLSTTNETIDLNRTVINAFKIKPCLSNKAQDHFQTNKSRSRNRLLTFDSNDSNDETYEKKEEEEGIIFESDEYEDSDDDDQNTLCLVDPECKKVIQGKDINNFYFSMVKWFNNLKDSFATSTPNSQKNTYKHFSDSIQKNGQSSMLFQSDSRKSLSKKTHDKKVDNLFDRSGRRLNFACEHSNLITGILKKDAKLNLKYEKVQNNKWEEKDICRYLKYKYFISKKNKFNDTVSIVPGIGNVYTHRLSDIVPNFGTLLELYISVKVDTFKALLYAYANISSRNLNLISTSCKNYFAKYGLDFRDTSIYIPKTFKFIDNTR